MGEQAPVGNPRLFRDRGRGRGEYPVPGKHNEGGVEYTLPCEYLLFFPAHAGVCVHFIDHILNEYMVNILASLYPVKTKVKVFFTAHPAAVIPGAFSPFRIYDSEHRTGRKES